MENNDLTQTETVLIITEQRRHIFALQREVRLLNRAIGRKKRKVDRLRARLDQTIKVNGILVDQLGAMMEGTRLISFPEPQQPIEMMTLDQAFAQHEARLAAGVQADPGIEVGGTTHGTREHGA